MPEDTFSHGMEHFFIRYFPDKSEIDGKKKTNALTDGRMNKLTNTRVSFGEPNYNDHGYLILLLVPKLVLSKGDLAKERFLTSNDNQRDNVTFLEVKQRNLTQIKVI